MIDVYRLFLIIVLVYTTFMNMHACKNYGIFAGTVTEFCIVLASLYFKYLFVLSRHAQAQGLKSRRSLGFSVAFEYRVHENKNVVYYIQTYYIKFLNRENKCGVLVFTDPIFKRIFRFEYRTHENKNDDPVSQI